MRSEPGAVATGYRAGTVAHFATQARSLPLPVLTPSRAGTCLDITIYAGHATPPELRFRARSRFLIVGWLASQPAAV
ncbi:MAG: hypothetical protein QOK48_648 [Blastocatellia bacterium]|nr:hypothetical protein [Blastocatellia bacterium]